MGEAPQVTLARRGPLPEPEALAQTRAQYEADLAEHMAAEGVAYGIVASFSAREVADSYNRIADALEADAAEYRMKAQDLIINAQESEAQG